MVLIMVNNGVKNYERYKIIDDGVINNVLLVNQCVIIIIFIMVLFRGWLLVLRTIKDTSHQH